MVSIEFINKLRVWPLSLPTAIIQLNQQPTPTRQSNDGVVQLTHA
jgi:hypothetical protein